MSFLVGYATPQDYGALGNGVHDDTAAINAAVAAASGPIFFPVGTYLVSSAIPLTEGLTLIGGGSGTYTHASAETSIIKLAAASNSSVFTIAAGVGGGAIRDLQIDGNKANQTGGGSAILFTAGGSTQEAQWKLERLYVHDSFGSGVEQQANRQANKILNSVLYNNAGYGVDASASDTTILGCIIGQNTLDGINANNAVIHIIDCDIWGNRAGVNMGSSGQGVHMLGCGVDRNLQNGVYCAASNVSISGCTFHSNSQSGNGAYSSIKVDNTFNAVSAVVIGPCDFWLDAGISNKVSYHIEYGNTATSQVVGAQNFQASSAATANIQTPASALQTAATSVTTANAIVGAAAALGDNGVGELQLANAGTVPTTNPTGGVDVYAASGIVRTRNPQGLVQSVSGNVQATTATTTIASSSTLTALQSFTVPANDPAAGAVYAFSGYGVYSVTGTPTMTFALYWGGVAGTLIAAVPAITAASGITNAPFFYEGMVTFRSTTSCTAVINLTVDTSTATDLSATYIGTPATATTVTTTGASALAVGFTWSVNSASNTISLLGGNVQRIA